MAQVGGFRPGAGRPVGGITQSRRVLDRAIQHGLAAAVRDHGGRGTDDDLALAGAAEIVRQMVRSGRGDEVLKIWAAIAPKGDDGPSGQQVISDSPLAAALGRMPGANGAPVAYLPGAVVGEDGAGTGDSDHVAADQQSAGRASGGLDGGEPCVGLVLLPGQLVLGVDAPVRVRAGVCADAGVRVQAGADVRAGVCADAGVRVQAGADVRAGVCADAGAPTPTPPQPPAREVIHLHGSNFDFVAEGDYWSGDENPDDHDSASDAPVVVGIARTGAAA